LAELTGQSFHNRKVFAFFKAFVVDPSGIVPQLLLQPSLEIGDLLRAQEALLAVVKLLLADQTFGLLVELLLELFVFCTLLDTKVVFEFSLLNFRCDIFVQARYFC
jgi:hypothetical protein